jgi:ATP-binding cassette subfamily C protein LapB
MIDQLIPLVSLFARMRGIELRPDWSDAASPLVLQGQESLEVLCAAIGWAEPRQYLDMPRANQFPVLVWHQRYGWAIGERLESGSRIEVQDGTNNAIWSIDDGCVLYDLSIPLPPRQKTFRNALDIFRQAIMERAHFLVVAAVATVIVNLLALATSLYSMQVYDRVVPRGAFATLWVLSIGAGGALLFDYILRMARSRLMEEESVRIDQEVSEFFFSRAMDVRLDARPPSIGTMAANLRGLENIRSLLSSSTLFLFADLPFAIFFIFIIYMLGGVIAFVPLISFPISLVMALWFGHMIRADAKKAYISGNRKNGLLVETLDAAETIKANRGHWFMLKRWNNLLSELHRAELPMKNIQARATTVFGTAQQFTYIAMIAWGAIEVFHHNMTMGALIACSILSGRVNGPLVGQLPGIMVQWSFSRSSLEMLDGILKLPTERPDDVELIRPAHLSARLEFKGVVFAYPASRVALTLPMLTINPGERIGVIGGIGSGKSTLLRLAAGLYTPSQGIITLDHLDLGHIAEDALRQNIAYLAQDYRLINGTLRENLVLGLPDPGDTVLMEMAAKTGLLRLINSHPKGLDLAISEGGRGLSGGQRVLTGITRMLLSEPKLWLLDEPTANLDGETEARVLTALQSRLQPRATMILVTHKIQLLSLTERILVMSDGQIVMDGPRDLVLARLQSGGRPPENGNSPRPVSAAITPMGPKS